MVHATGCIFDGTANNSRSRREPDGFGDDFGRVSKAILKIGADRQIRGGCNRRQVRHHLGTVDGVVLLPDGKGISGTGGGKRLIAEVRQQPRRANVPWIGNNERGITLVESAKGTSLVSLRPLR